MKIIDGKDCYIQRADVDYLIDNNVDIPSELFFELNMNVLNDNDFIKIENNVAKKFILQSKIPFFDELYFYSVEELNDQLFKIRLSVFDSDEYESGELDEMIRMKRIIEYRINQIKEMIAFKNRTSKLVYPNIPNPNYASFSNDYLVASRSMNPDKVLIYNIYGTNIGVEDDPAFCELAYQMLMYDCDIDEELMLSYEIEDKYLVLKNINKAYTKKRKTRQ